MNFDTIEKLTLNGKDVDLNAAVLAEPGVTIQRTSTTTATTEQGGQVQYSVVLNKQPISKDNVTIQFTSSDTTEGKVNTPSLTFTPQNWSTPQTLTIQGVDDYEDDSNVAYTINAKIVTNDLTYTRVKVSALNLINNDDGQDTPVVWNGGNGVDYYEGKNGNDILYAGGGQDQIKGGRGNDEIYGEGDNDRLFGEDGSDEIYGGYGKDTLDGGAGSDSLFGEQGQDSLIGGNTSVRLRQETV